MKIYLHFTGTDAVTFGASEDVVNTLQQIAIEQEKAVIRQIRKEIPEIPPQAVTHAINTLETPIIQHQAILVSAVKPGSVGVWIAITAFGYWVVDKTLGETLKETWKESETHRKLKQFFLKARGDKLRAIQQRINHGIRKLKAREARKNVDIEVPMHAKLDESRLELSIRIDCSDEVPPSERIPAYDELIERDSRGD